MRSQVRRAWALRAVLTGPLGAGMLLVATGSATERVCCLTLDLPL